MPSDYESPDGRPHEAASDAPRAVRSVSYVDDGASDPGATARDEEIRSQASAMVDPIVREIAALGPPGWLEFTTVFALTIRAGSATCGFVTAEGPQPVTVPASIMAQVARQRDVSAQMSAGPWWRLLLKVTNQGQLQISYDYGDQPFPDDQLQPAENYRADIATYPRPQVPIWLAGYMAGPAAQGRTPAQAAADAVADTAAGRHGVNTDDIEPLPQTFIRWALLAAVYSGARSPWGPRIEAGVAWYESDARSGSTLYLLPAQRAVLSGGRWNSPLLAAAYQRHQPLPDLYRGAPEWVNDTVLNSRNQNGLLSFCYWWTEGQWWRGDTDTFDELDDPLPPIWTPKECIAAMTTVVGSGAEWACGQLLAAAEARTVTPELLTAVFAGNPNVDLRAAHDQLRLAGVTG